MKDPHEILREKELSVNRLRTEIAALHSVISLLVEASDWAEYGLALPPSPSQLQGVGTASGKYQFRRSVATDAWAACAKRFEACRTRVAGFSYLMGDKSYNLALLEEEFDEHFKKAHLREKPAKRSGNR